VYECRRFSGGSVRNKNLPDIVATFVAFRKKKDTTGENFFLPAVSRDAFY